jgi:hypothetical protein
MKRGLSQAQWNFKESPDRWSINCRAHRTWETTDHRNQLRLGAGLNRSAKMAYSDSEYVAFIMEEKPHISDEYTKPFTFTIPMG